jgi:hypothetical protein
VEYPICDALLENAAIHCAALVITENVVTGGSGLPSFAQPSDELRSGTITFVKYGGRVYGITCWHVIEIYRKYISNSGKPFSHSMRTMVNGFYVVLDRFVKPSSDFGLPDVNIAIREINGEHVMAIGKVPYDLDSEAIAPSNINLGYAVGFPEALKKKVNIDSFGHQISMPQVEILAELNGMPGNRFSLNSELPERPEQEDYSGMSGGPIFWSTENDYGIFGIIYEGGIGSTLSDGKSVHIYGEKAGKQEIVNWISQVNCQQKH